MVRVKNITLKTKIRSKKQELLVGNIQQYRTMIQSHDIKITKRTLLSIAAQCFDPSGSLLALPIFMFKCIFRHLTSFFPNMEWDQIIDPKYTKWLDIALEIFFIAREYQQPYFNITYHPNATHHLVCMSDTGENYYAHIILLVTQLGDKHNKTFHSKNTFPLKKSWITPKGFSTPEAELLSLVTLLKSGGSIKTQLEEVGIQIRKEHIYFLIDSSCSLLWVCSIRVQFEKRIQCLISKGQVYLYTHDLSPFDHVYWFD